MKKILLALACAFAYVGFADTIDISKFTKTCDFTISGYSGESTLTDFPVLVRLSESANKPSGFRYSDCLSDGSDVRFTDSEGTILSSEVDTWDTTGESLIWVKVPSLSGNNTVITMYFGAAQGTAPAITASDTWSKYVTVIHGGSGITDSSPKSLALTANTVSATATGGIVGGGMNKPDRNTIGVNIPNPSKNGKLTNSRQYSMSFWAKSATASDSGTHVTLGGVVNWGNGGFLGLFEKGQGWSVAVSGTHHYTSGTGKLLANTWTYTAFCYDTQAGHLTSYSDGESIFDAGSNSYDDANGVDYWTLGGYSNKSAGDNFYGDLDEFRIYDGIASADWIKAEYDSVNVAAFAVGGMVNVVQIAAPIVIVNTASDYFGIDISVKVSSFGDNATSANLNLILADNDAFVNPVATLSKTSSEVSLETQYEIEATSLTAGTVYYLHVVSVNDLDNKCDKVVELSTKTIDPCAFTIDKEKSGADLASFWWKMTGFGIDSTYASLVLQYSTSDDFSSPVEQEISAKIETLPVNGRAVARELAVSTPYYVRLKAVNSLGRVCYTDAISFTTASSDDNTRTWANTGTDMNDAASYVENLAPNSNSTIYFTEPMKTQPCLTAGMTVKALFFGRYDGQRTSASDDPSGYVFTAANDAVLTLSSSGNNPYAINSSTSDGCEVIINLPILLTGNNPQLAANGTKIDLRGNVATSGEYTQDVCPSSSGADDNHRGMIIFSAANPDFKPSKIHCSNGNLAIGHPQAFSHVREIASGNWGSMVPRLYNLTGVPVVMDELLKFSRESYGLNQLNFEGAPFVMTNCVFDVSPRSDKWRVTNAEVYMKTIGGWDSGHQDAFVKGGTNVLEFANFEEGNGITCNIEIRQGLFYPHNLLATVARENRRCRINGDDCNATDKAYPTLGVDTNVRIPVSNLGGISFGRDGERKGGGFSGMGGEVSVTLVNSSNEKIELVDDVKTPENSGYIAPYPWAFGNCSSTGTVGLENDISRTGDTDIYAIHGRNPVPEARLKGKVTVSNGHISIRGNGVIALEGGVEMTSDKCLRSLDTAGMLVNCDLSGDDFLGKVYYNGNGWLGGTGRIKQFHFEAANSALRGGEFGRGTLTVTGPDGADFKFAASCGVIVDITPDGSCGLLKFEGDLTKYSSNWSGHWMKILPQEGAPAGKYKVMDWSDGTGSPTKMMTAEAYTLQYDSEKIKSASLVVENNAMYLKFYPRNPHLGLKLIIR